MLHNLLCTVGDRMRRGWVFGSGYVGTIVILFFGVAAFDQVFSSSKPCSCHFKRRSSRVLAHRISLLVQLDTGAMFLRMLGRLN